MQRKLARDIVIGDYVNVHEPNPNYMDPCDCELSLVRVEKIVDYHGEIKCYVYTPVDEDDPNTLYAPYWISSYCYYDEVPTWTAEEAEAYYRVNS